MLTGSQIRAEVDACRIVIDPFDPQQLNPNSYNVRLGNLMKVYTDFPLDTRRHNPVKQFEIPEQGFTLQPGRLYLGVTVETTHTPYHIPEIGGRSSTARLGVPIHQTGGFGDLGFRGTWTLEISVVHAVRVYAGDEVAQIWFWNPEGEIGKTYDKTGRYFGQTLPEESRMHLAKPQRI